MDARRLPDDDADHHALLAPDSPPPILTAATHLLTAELPLRRAAVWADDGGLSLSATLGDVLARWPQITPAAFWNLTVAEHAALIGQIREEAVPTHPPEEQDHGKS